MTAHEKRILDRIRDEDVAVAVREGCNQLGRRLREIRHRSGVTLRDVDDQCGINYESLRKKEVGVYTVTVMDLLILAEYYGVSMDWLFGREGYGNG